MSVYGACQALGGREWETQREARALAEGAFAVDGPVVLAHDPVGDRKAQPRSLPDRLRREERIVDARKVFAGDARTGVGDFDDRLPVFRARRYRQPAAFRHRVLSVEERVQEYLLQLLFATHDGDRLLAQLA